jgi:ABC-2 type transport system permease protein
LKLIWVHLKASVIELVWSAVFEQPWPLLPCLGLLIYTLIFGVLAVWGYRRDEGQHYH